MKREFLQNLKSGGEALSKEVIDAIMAENGRDIEAAKSQFADYDTVKQQLSEAQKTIKSFQDGGQDVETLRQQAKDWETKYNDAIAEAQRQAAEMEFQGNLKEAITSAKGRNAKAIAALLDMGALRASKDQSKDIKSALEQLKKDNGYLFENDETPPPYSAGTGTGTGGVGAGKYSPEMAAIRSAAGLKND